MHYKNGREAKNGDKIVIVDGYMAGTSGVLADAVAGNDYCNGKLLSPVSIATPNLKECLHLDDVLGAVKAAESSEAAATESP
jgi:hydroxymethylpyrimidine/phosphomethylpyrimidine kinase